ncbi:MAG TPA: large conductance mechanosensitive channel protein MscL [Peptococcaceae bacterium]|nr:large conductance mechanosensitive channel protein MscL [Peptococcaceae bacterium]
MSMMKDFKDFAMKGNVLDLAVAVIIGGAFGKIVSSLVNDIVMPLISMLLGNTNISALAVTLKEAQGDIPALQLRYGLFIQNIIDFILIAFSIFMMIKIIQKAKKPVEAAPAAPPAPSQEAVLLGEIKTLLENQSK